MKRQQSSDSYFSKSADKALRILTIFNEDKTRFSLSEIREKLGINTTSTFRYVNTLTKLGYLIKDRETKLISVGPKAITLSNTLLKSYDLLNLVKPLIDQLHERHKISIFFGIFNETVIDLIYVRQIQETLGMVYPRFNQLIHCTAFGKAALAYLPENEALEIIGHTSLIKKTPHTITSKQDLIAEIKDIKRKGYSLNNEELVQGMISIAAPTGYIDTNRSIGTVAFDFCTLFHSIVEIESTYAPIILDLARNINEIVPDLRRFPPFQYRGSLKRGRGAEATNGLVQTDMPARKTKSGRIS